MDLGTSDRHRGGYQNHAHQPGLFFWPWAAASYGSPGAPTPSELESLYRLGYPHPIMDAGRSSAAAVAAAAAAVNNGSGGNQGNNNNSSISPPLHTGGGPPQSHMTSQGHSHILQQGQLQQQQQHHGQNLPVSMSVHPGGGQLGAGGHPQGGHYPASSHPLGSSTGGSAVTPPGGQIPGGMEGVAVTPEGLMGSAGPGGMFPNIHMDTPAPTKGYKCKICQQLCFSRHDLTKHNANVHKQDPRPYRCEHCGRQFSTSAYLSQHRRIHLGVKPYACRFCDRRFTQLSHVQQHERIHTGDKPYKCCTCYKCFTQMSNLQSHQRQHMKGKPCRCEHCFMCFDTQEELDTHIQAKHAGHKYSKILVCPICAKNYNSETYLNKHIMKHKESSMTGNLSMSGDHQQPPPAHQGLKMKMETNPCSPLGGLNRNCGPPGSGGGGMDGLLGNSPSSMGGGSVPGYMGGGGGMVKDRHNMFRDMAANNNNNPGGGGGPRSMSPNGGMGSGGPGGNGGNKIGPFCAPRVASSVSAVDPFCMQYPGATNPRLAAGFNPAAVAYSALMDHHHNSSAVSRETPYDMIPSFTFPNFRF